MIYHDRYKSEITLRKIQVHKKGKHTACAVIDLGHEKTMLRHLS